MNYANRDAAQALKDAGFDVPVTSAYGTNGNLIHTDAAYNYNKSALSITSAPDFLTAADWISKKSDGKIRIALCVYHTTFYNTPFNPPRVFESKDHRNAAIIHALQELKKLKDANNSTT
jgi:hypothetical protein